MWLFLMKKMDILFHKTLSNAFKNQVVFIWSMLPLESRFLPCSMQVLWTKPWSNCSKSIKLTKLIGRKPIPLILEGFLRKNHVQAFCKTLPLIWNHQTKSMVKRWRILWLELHHKWHLAHGWWSSIWKYMKPFCDFPNHERFSIQPTWVYWGHNWLDWFCLSPSKSWITNYFMLWQVTMKWLNFKCNVLIPNCNLLPIVRLSQRLSLPWWGKHEI